MTPSLHPGQFLLAEPFLPDVSFQRSVLLLCEHNTDGSIGLIMNQSLKMKWSDIQEDNNPNFDSQFYLGGPVGNDTLHFIHKIADLPDAVEIIPGVYWNGDFDELRNRIHTKKIFASHIKFFLGYSAWYPDQLEDEIKESTWVTTPATASYIFSADTKNLWRDIMQSLGGEYTSLANAPASPLFN